MEKKKRIWKVDTHAFSVRLPVKLAKTIRKLAFEKELSPNQLIKRIIEQHIGSN